MPYLGTDQVYPGPIAIEPGDRGRAPAASSRTEALSSVDYLRRTILVAEDFFSVLRDGVVVSLCFGCPRGSGDDVSASVAFSAVANAASPLIKSVQASS
jgi:hypothetical protein